MAAIFGITSTAGIPLCGTSFERQWIGHFDMLHVLGKRPQMESPISLQMPISTLSTPSQRILALMYHWLILTRQWSTILLVPLKQEAWQLLLRRISVDLEFYKSLERSDPGEEEDQENNGYDNDRMVCYDEIDSSKTINAEITEILRRTPADSLAEIYADDDGGVSSESDTEGKGTGDNLDEYTGAEFSTCGATEGWMEWNSK